MITKEEFRAWRAVVGVTQRKAAELLGVGKSNYEKYEMKGLKYKCEERLHQMLAVLLVRHKRMLGRNWEYPTLEHRGPRGGTWRPESG